MDGVNLPLVAAVDEILHHRVADFSLLRRRTDDRHGVGLHDAAHGPQDILLGGPRPHLSDSEIHQNAHVHGRGARAVGKHRVEVQLADLGKIVHQPRDVFDHRPQGIAIHPRGAARAAQDFGAGNVVKHAYGFVAGCRSQAEGHVLHHFDHDPAHAEGHKLAETGVRDRPDNDLVVGIQHALYLHTVDDCVWLMGSGIGHNCGVGLLDLCRRVQSRDNATGVRLVENAGGGDLENHGKTNPLRLCARLIDRSSEAFRRRGDTVRLADPLPLLHRKGAAPIRPYLVEDCPYRGLIVAHDSSPQGCQRNCVAGFADGGIRQEGQDNRVTGHRTARRPPLRGHPRHPSSPARGCPVPEIRGARRPALSPAAWPVTAPRW